MLKPSTCCLLFIFSISAAQLSCGEDWYRFRGPNLDGISREEFSPTDWMKTSVSWKQNVQTGLSGIVASEGRVYTMGNEDDQDTVFCLSASTGDVVWKHSYPAPVDANEFEGGPTSTPTIDDHFLFTLSREGEAYCFDKANGQVIWNSNIPDETGIRIPGWGFAGSPLVIAERLLLNIGDAGVALEKQTGKVIWQSGDKDSGYSSIVPIRSGDRSAVVFGSSRSYVCVDVESGQEQWRHRWLTTFGCNAADPIVSREGVFISSGYNRGSALLRITEDGVETVWKHKELQNQISTSILINGYVYGIHGDVDEGTELRCINLETGELEWAETDFHPGSIAAVGTHLIVVTDEGRLIIGEAGRAGFKVTADHAVLEEKCWTSPVLSGGRIYCRSSLGELVCLESAGKTD